MAGGSTQGAILLASNFIIIRIINIINGSLADIEFWIIVWSSGVTYFAVRSLKVISLIWSSTVVNIIIASMIIIIGCRSIVRLITGIRVIIVAARIEIIAIIANVTSTAARLKIIAISTITGIIVIPTRVEISM